MLHCEEGNLGELRRIIEEQPSDFDVDFTIA
jgi:hypothetical protein